MPARTARFCAKRASRVFKLPIPGNVGNTETIHGGSSGNLESQLGNVNAPRNAR